MELLKDVLFGLGTDRSGLPTSLIGDRKLRGVAVVLLTLKERPDLLVTKRSVKLFSHGVHLLSIRRF